MKKNESSQTNQFKYYMRAILVDCDNQKTLGTSVSNDIQNMKMFLVKNISFDLEHIKEIGQQHSRQDFFDAVDQIKNDKETIFFFLYLTGHGYSKCNNEKNNKMDSEI